MGGGSETNKRPLMRGWEAVAPSEYRRERGNWAHRDPAGGKGGATWREPLTGNRKGHAPCDSVHETTMDSRTGVAARMPHPAGD
jgi:hypothetical protein